MSVNPLLSLRHVGLIISRVTYDMTDTRDSDRIEQKYRIFIQVDSIFSPKEISV